MSQENRPARPSGRPPESGFARLSRTESGRNDSRCNDPASESLGNLDWCCDLNAVVPRVASTSDHTLDAEY